ncbi:MAG: hypothetical protein JWP44_4901 [Mucilaginibacter sp.]|jgi:hypothetical protein|nr:hypothetical protein [Mucilaginibacter sp.]
MKREDSEKSVSRASEEAMREMDEHTAQRDADKVPLAGAVGHPRSHAAHPDEKGSVQTKPPGDLRQGASPGELREPPPGGRGR